MGIWGHAKAQRREGPGFREPQGGQCGWGREGEGVGVELQSQEVPAQEDLRDHCRVFSFMVREMGGAGGL